MKEHEKQYCPHCEKILPSTEFIRSNYCKPCKKEVAKDSWYKRTYGISLEDYKYMFESQKGLCALCLQPETTIHPKTGEIQSLAIDHCHSKGYVRGLLCSNCNNGLGRFRDNAEVLRRAADYLEEKPKYARKYNIVSNDN